LSDERPVLIISDLHIGRPRMVETAEEVAPLVDAASVLIINGDCAELHIDRWADTAARELEALRERCRRAGTRLVLLSGNHDPQLSPDRHLMLADDSVFVTHGDAIDPALAPWSDSAAIIRHRRREVEDGQRTDERESLPGIFHACREAAAAEWLAHGDLGKPTSILEVMRKPQKIAAITRFWISNPKKVNAFADRHAPRSRAVIVGHSHRAGIRRIGSRDIINTGAFGVPGPALGVVLDERGLHVHRLIKRGSWRLTTTVVHHDPACSLRAGGLEASLPAIAH
jgi:UDP-2,3-diacylglucosamine pyrophosphatase LpxH